MKASKLSSLKKRLAALQEINWSENITMDNIEDTWLSCLSTLTTSPDKWPTSQLAPLLGVCKTTLLDECHKNKIPLPAIPPAFSHHKPYTFDNITDSLMAHFARYEVNYNTAIRRWNRPSFSLLSLEERFKKCIEPVEKSKIDWSSMPKISKLNYLKAKLKGKGLLKFVPSEVYETKRIFESTL